MYIAINSPDDSKERLEKKKKVFFIGLENK